MGYIQITTEQAKGRMNSDKPVYGREFGGGKIGRLNWINWNNSTAMQTIGESGRMIMLYDTIDGEKQTDPRIQKQAEGDTEFFRKTND